MKTKEALKIAPPPIPEEKAVSPYDIIICRAGTIGCLHAIINPKPIADKIEILLDELGLGKHIKTKAKGKLLYHMKFKIALAGCPNACPQPQIKTFGISGQARPAATDAHCVECIKCVDICKEDGAIKIIDARPVFDYSLCVLCDDCAEVCPTESIVIEKKGFKVMANGKLGRHPKLADVIKEVATEDEIYEILKDVVEEYINQSSNS
ncbi:MAG: 4Fe-4S binding protein [Deltaproteobacteria bacterium]|nr:4Fe-4S binding protein [Deltaproteobacteria bacterium]